MPTCSPSRTPATWRCGLSAVALARPLARELDWVVARALAREREWRYETRAALSRDIERLLAGETRRRPSWRRRP